MLALSGFIASFVLVFLVRRWFRRHSHAYCPNAPQRFHAGTVPRLGGVGMCVAWLLVVWLAVLLPQSGVPLGITLQWQEALGFTLTVLAAVAAGAYEDLTQRVPVRWRLLLTAASGVLAVALLGAMVPRLGWAWFDQWWMAWPLLGAAFAVLAIAGLPHAFNIIDGYNGLAGTVAVVISLALAYVALQVGDRQLALLALSLAASTLGFLVWNYPRGWIFAGDGGAYLWGVVIAVVGVLLVARHGAVSPWFVMLLLIYPVWETVFSMYRKWARGVSPGMADALHLHQLVYRRVVRAVLEPDEARRLLKRNNRTTPYLIAFASLSVVPAVLFWNNTPVLMGCCALFVLAYVVGYLMIIRFKVPGWVKR